MPNMPKKRAKEKKEKEDDGTDINLAEGRISIVGTQPDKVNKVLKMHQQMAGMMKKMRQKGGMKNMMNMAQAAGISPGDLAKMGGAGGGLPGLGGGGLPPGMGGLPGLGGGKKK